MITLAWKIYLTITIPSIIALTIWASAQVKNYFKEKKPDKRLLAFCRFVCVWLPALLETGIVLVALLTRNLPIGTQGHFSLGLPKIYEAVIFSGQLLLVHCVILKEGLLFVDQKSDRG